MGKNIVQARKSEAGFTLVELAIVMIIIGLLIGGVLKGQELIANAQVAATISQVKGFDAATSTFRDVYDGVPGDIAAARLPNCVVNCIPPAANLGNGRVDANFGAVPAGEGLAFWLQLNAADLVSGVNENGAAVTFGGQMPSAELGGGYMVDFTNALAELPVVYNAAGAIPRAGHYIALAANPVAIAAGNVGLTPSQGFRIDRKMDDGAADTGIVRGFGGPAGAASCSNGGGYNEALTGQLCGLYIRFQM